MDLPVSSFRIIDLEQALVSVDLEKEDEYGFVKRYTELLFLIKIPIYALFKRFVEGIL